MGGGAGACSPRVGLEDALPRELRRSRKHARAETRQECSCHVTGKSPPSRAPGSTGSLLTQKPECIERHSRSRRRASPASLRPQRAEPAGAPAPQEEAPMPGAASDRQSVAGRSGRDSRRAPGPVGFPGEPRSDASSLGARGCAGLCGGWRGAQVCSRLRHRTMGRLLQPWPLGAQQAGGRPSARVESADSPAPALTAQTCGGSLPPLAPGVSGRGAVRSLGALRGRGFPAPPPAVEAENTPAVGQALTLPFKGHFCLSQFLKFKRK